MTPLFPPPPPPRRVRRLCAGHQKRLPVCPQQPAGGNRYPPSARARTRCPPHRPGEKPGRCCRAVWRCQCVGHHGSQPRRGFSRLADCARTRNRSREKHAAIHQLAAPVAGFEPRRYVFATTKKPPQLRQLRGLIPLYKHILGEVIGIVVVQRHFAHVPVHLALVLAHELVERQVAAGGFLELEKDFVVFQTRDTCFAKLVGCNA
jgi:hypothetical protein